MGPDDAIVAGVRRNASVQVAGAEVKEPIRTFDHLANAS
jgi:hypothetical protein